MATMANTILSVISATAAAVAAVCAVLALRTANATIKEAKAARLDAERAARDAAADRRQAERERERRRVEHIGEIVEAIASAAREPDGGRWMVHRNRLMQALAGQRQRFPQATRFENCSMPEDALCIVPSARNEVEIKLASMEAERDPSADDGAGLF